MGDRLIGLTVKGNRKKWGFSFYGDPKYLQEWRDDGLDVSEIENVIPVWVVEWRLTRPWCFLQDVFNLRNPFR